MAARWSSIIPGRGRCGSVGAVSDPGEYGYVVSELGNPKKPPLPYPDNVKLIKRTVLGSVVYMVVALTVGIAVTLVLGPGRPQWVNIALAVALPCGLLAVLMWVGRSWLKEDLQRQRDLQRLRTGTELAPAPDTDVVKPRRRRVPPD